MLRDGFWSDPTAADWLAAAGGTAGFSALAIELWRSRRRRRRPPDDLLRHLSELSGWFDDVIAGDGREWRWFRTPERRHLEQLLAIVAGQLVDDELRGLVEEARSAWYGCSELGRARGIDSPDKARRQLEFAHDGRAAAGKAVDRASELIRQTR